MKILAIETSCDETAAAVLEVNRGIFNLKSNIVSSQVKIHAKYGGIVPEVAARKQMEMIIPVLEQALKQASSNNQETISKNIDYLAVTQGPGLVTSLVVGVETAKTLAAVLNKPLVAVNHLAGHIYANFLKQKIGEFPISNFQFPTLCLVVSGGHTVLILMKKHNQFQVVGETLDDAAGEAFDKVAKILGLGYPGGPIIAKLAAKGNPRAFDLPRPMLQSHDFNFSFSGLKTAVLYLTLKHKSIKARTFAFHCHSERPFGSLRSLRAGSLGLLGAEESLNPVVSKAEPLFEGLKEASMPTSVGDSSTRPSASSGLGRNDPTTVWGLANVKVLKALKQKQDLCASFQQAVVDVLVTKTIKAAEKFEPRTILLGGGVAANLALREQLEKEVKTKFPQVKFLMPELKFTGDNAAMIAVAAYFKIINHQQLTINKIKKIKAEPNLVL